MRARIKRVNGVLKIDIDGKVLAPLSFKSFRPNPKNVSEFYEAGVRLFSVFSTGLTSALGVPYSLYGESWIGDGEYDFSAIDRQMDMFIENAPEAYFAPMLQVDTRNWYIEKHGVPNSFTHLSQVAHDARWRGAAAEYIKAAISHLEEKYGDRIYGYFLMGGTTTEWFSHWDKEASHPIKEVGYRRWKGDDTATLPSLERLCRTGEVFLGEDETDVYLARCFHAQTISELVLYFAGEAQKIIKHNKLLGVYFGYLFELGGERLYYDGALDYERVFFSPDIDMISSPSAYGYRKLTDPSAFMLTQKTLDAHGKLYFLEFDHITHVAPEEIKDGRDADAKNMTIVKIPGSESKCKNECESLNLMYRDFLLCNANGAAMWWFDMFDGWFRSEGMMGAVSHMIDMAQRLGERCTDSVADIAVFAEGEAMYRARRSAGLATLTLSDIRRTLAECGCAYDLYSIGDVDNVQLDKYRLLMFINQYDISEERVKNIKKAISGSGSTVLWLYAPSYARDGKLDVKTLSETVKMTVTESSLSHGALNYNGARAEYDIKAPYFAVNDGEAEPLSHFDDGCVAAAEKNTDGYRSVYVASCNLPSDMLRDIAERAGAHIYSRDAHVYVYPSYASVGVYNATDSDAVISVRADGPYIDLIEGGKYIADGGRLALPKKPINAYLLVKEN